MWINTKLWRLCPLVGLLFISGIFSHALADMRQPPLEPSSIEEAVSAARLDIECVDAVGSFVRKAGWQIIGRSVTFDKDFGVIYRIDFSTRADVLGHVNRIVCWKGDKGVVTEIALAQGIKPLERATRK